jgi:NAD(P)-dependent dehydrogenase (short-subunit alcohol dehydrogenase family)
MQIEGARALVTGGGSGLGKATAAKLVRHGAKVTILDLPDSNGRSVARDLSAFYVTCDISDYVGAEKAVREAGNLMGGLDIAVNVAGGGGGPPRRVVNADGPYPLEQFQRAIDINLVASFNLNRIEAWLMQQNNPDSQDERGIMINTSSNTAFGGPVGLVNYSAAKAGVAALSLGIARDLAPYGIRCMAIAPSLFSTGLIGHLDDDARRELLTEAVFPKRMGEPEEFAELVMAIVTNSMLNGDTIRLDGGTRRAIRDHLNDRLF